MQASHFVCCSSVRAEIGERLAICQNGRLLIRVTARGPAGPAWQQLGSPFRSASGLPQSLNEKASGLVANHWCGKQINSAGLYFPNILSNTGIKSSDGHQGAKRSRGWKSGRVETERKVSAFPATSLGGKLCQLVCYFFFPFLVFCYVVLCIFQAKKKKKKCVLRIWAATKCSCDIIDKTKTTF